MRTLSLLLLLLVPALPGCGHDHDHEGEHAAGSGDPAEHSHEPPHGGTLVVLGDEFAHVELILDPTTGVMTAYLFDAHVENPVRSPQEEIGLRARIGDRTVDVTLAAHASSLTGETVGDTSQFVGTSVDLRGVTRFDGTLLNVSLLGRRFEEVEFRFPEGNE